MPRIFDNIEQDLLPALQETIELSRRADFCVGYFNLRGWKHLVSSIDKFSGGDDNQCRLLLGMQQQPRDELAAAIGLSATPDMDNATAQRLRVRYALDLRDQLTLGTPTNEDELCLRTLSRQIQQGKVRVKVFLRHPLHAKLYLHFRADPINPIVGYLGSSNLTLAGLSKQGELNVDVLDHDATNKLAQWFEDRWNDRFCVDISDELVQIINESWARETPIPPYHIYIKIAYHLSQEARSGLSEFRIPKDFEKTLFKFQTEAVKIAAHHLNKRGGVLIGDVVGLGKTFTATALAKIFEDDYDYETLILCPKNLVGMWEDYREQYGLRGKVMSVTRAMNDLPALRRYRIAIIDESQNLRNREGKRYKAIHEYLHRNETKVVLLSATPYNKSYIDLSNQLRLFVPDDRDLGIRPELLIREIGEAEFLRRYQCPFRSLPAFEKSEYPDDWRELMRLYLVRRTRSFIIENYATYDETKKRHFLKFADGTRSYFPIREPKTIKFSINDSDPEDQYARLYSDNVVNAINSLLLPRYGLGNYIEPSPAAPPTQKEGEQIRNLSRAGKRLMGFCRVNLFKRLESSGSSFLLSIQRHILRNYVYLHAIATGQSIPVGAQDASLIDPASDMDMEDVAAIFEPNEEDFEKTGEEVPSELHSAEQYRARAEQVYDIYRNLYPKRFQWISPALFVKVLAIDLSKDCEVLLKILNLAGAWNATKDAKLAALEQLICRTHRSDKVLLFSQFADTVEYLERQLKARGVRGVEGVTGNTENPTSAAWRFSPTSNKKNVSQQDELRVLLATDVLSEGQNLQDGHIVVNFDLPWAIIRLVQRAGRVDRIGQTSDNILCYSFLPAEGVERIIRLRSRVRARLHQNAEVVGADEAFFEDEREDQVILNLYHEKADLTKDDDKEVDLGSQALEIWHRAIKRDPELQKIIPDLPPVVYSTKPHMPSENKPEGVLIYVKTPEDNDELAMIDLNGKIVTESQVAILEAAKCEPDTPALDRFEQHHELVRKGAEFILSHDGHVGGQLGRPSSPRYKLYERLKRHAERVKGTLFDTQELHHAIEDIYQYPLTEQAAEIIKRQLKAGAQDHQLAELAITMRDEQRLCLAGEADWVREPRIICSLGLKSE